MAAAQWLFCAMKLSYSEKLKDPRWQKKRLEVLERDKWQCRRCYDRSKTLHVHHKVYLKGFEPWDYDKILLVSVCEKCHLLLENERDELLARIDPRHSRGFLLMAQAMTALKGTSVVWGWAVESLIQCLLSAEEMCLCDLDHEEPEDYRTQLNEKVAELVRNVHEAMFAENREMTKKMEEERNKEQAEKSNDPPIP